MANTCGLFIGLQWRWFFSWRPNYVFVIAPFHYFSVALLKENVLIFSVWKVWCICSGMGSSEHYRQSSPSGYGPRQDGIFIFPKTKAWAGLRMMWTSGTWAVSFVLHSNIARFQLRAPYRVAESLPVPQCPHLEVTTEVWPVLCELMYLACHSLCLSVPICRSRQRFDECCMNSCLSLQLYLACHRCRWPWLLLLATSCSVPHAFFGSVGSEDGHAPGCPSGSRGLFGATWAVQNNRFERHSTILC